MFWCELLLIVTVWYKWSNVFIEKDTLLLNDQANKYRALDNWFTSPQGIRVAHAFADELEHVGEQLSGENLLQLGSCGENLWLPALKYRNKFIVTPCNIPQKTSLMTSLTTLPVERDSIDCVIAPLTLEAFSHGKNPIEEIDRVLKPMGYAIFFGINPCSFWGAALHLRRLKCFGSLEATSTSSFTTKRMMLQRGYTQCAMTSFYYIPPVSSSFWVRNLAFFNEMGKMIWPFPAGFYCLIVQKYQPASPDLIFGIADEVRLLQQKSVIQAISKWIHD